MAGVSRRDFLQHVGGASAALTFMIANGITLDASPLGLPIGSQMWPHRARIARSPNERRIGDRDDKGGTEPLAQRDRQRESCETGTANQHVGALYAIRY